MTFDAKVMAQMALSNQRATYIESWLGCYEIGGDIAYWAKRIERVNDAVAAVGAVETTTPPSGWESVG